MAANSRKKKKKTRKFYSILETLVEELESNLVSLSISVCLAAAGADSEEVSSDNNRLILGFEERLELLKKLVCAEFASNPENTKHLRHIFRRLYTLEEAFHHVLDHQMISSHHTTTYGQRDYDDDDSLCSCSTNHDDDHDDDDDDDVVEHEEDEDEATISTVHNIASPIKVVNYDDEISPPNSVVEIEEEAIKRSGTKRSSSTKFIIVINYCLLLILLLITFSAFFFFYFLFPYSHRHQQESTPT